MVNRLIATRDDTAVAVVRIVLGLVMLPHALQKIAGWFGGAGFGGTLGFFTGMLGIPVALAVLAILAESLGAVALVAGLGSRFGAAAIASVMLGAIVLVHFPNGFFMNWFGTQAGEGFEYHLLALGMSVAVLIRGGGSWSLDLWLSRRTGTSDETGTAGALRETVGVAGPVGGGERRPLRRPKRPSPTREGAGR